MTRSLYQEKFADLPLTASKLVLWTYTSERLYVSGEMQCDVLYKNIHYSLPVVVVNYRGKPTLAIRQKLAESNQIGMGWDFYCSESELQTLLSKYDLFSDSYAGMTGLSRGTYSFERGCKPNFCKSPSSSLCIEGTSRKIVRHTLGNTIVVAPKSDNTVRICGDYMATINQAVEDEPRVLPTT